MIRRNDLLYRRLGALASGENATVDSVLDEGWPGKRLADMGFVPGAALTVVRAGSPCIVRIEGRCLALGAGYQDSICMVPPVAEVIPSTG